MSILNYLFCQNSSDPNKQSLEEPSSESDNDNVENSDDSSKTQGQLSTGAYQESQDTSRTLGKNDTKIWLFPGCYVLQFCRVLLTECICNWYNELHVVLVYCLFHDKYLFKSYIHVHPMFISFQVLKKEVSL